LSLFVRCRAISFAERFGLPPRRSWLSRRFLKSDAFWLPLRLKPEQLDALESSPQWAEDIRDPPGSVLFFFLASPLKLSPYSQGNIATFPSYARPISHFFVFSFFQMFFSSSSFPLPCKFVLFSKLLPESYGFPLRFPKRVPGVFAKPGGLMTLLLPLLFIERALRFFFPPPHRLPTCHPLLSQSAHRRIAIRDTSSLFCNIVDRAPRLCRRHSPCCYCYPLR